MPAPIALQLYTVRDLAAKDFVGVVTKVAELGYVGVEPAGYPGTTPAEAAKLFTQLGLKVCSAHMGMPVGDNKAKVLDEAAVLGVKRIVSGFGPDQFKTPDLIKKTCATINEAAANAKAAGRQFGLHNHWWEFSLVEGTEQRAYKFMLQHLSRDVFFEVDTYWVQTGGADPAAVVKELGKRAPLLHIKDGPCAQGQHMTAIGDGKVGFPAIVKAAGKNCEWMIVELDSCATDMMEAVVKSYKYLVSNKLAQGNK